MRLGFVGCKEGMTRAQKEFTRRYIAENCMEIEEAHHGDAMGADDEFDTMIRLYAMAYCKICTHPSNVEQWRAYVECKEHIGIKPKLVTVVYGERPLVLRNCDLVASVDIIIVAPKPQESRAYANAWFSYRYAIRLGIKTILIQSDGTAIL